MRARLFSIFTALALATAACSDGADSPAPQAAGGAAGAAGANPGGAGGAAGAVGSGKVTVMVYMVADNNLEPAAVRDLQEMIAVGSDERFTMLTQTDRAEHFSKDGVGGLDNWTGAKRLKVEKGALVEKADLGKMNMSSSESLADFIGWAAQEAPADRYVLILWDHGGAWPGFGDDYSAGAKNGIMTLNKLTQGLTDGMKAAQIEKFALIGFDACLMSSLETTLSLGAFTDHMLASEELEPAHGWDYNSFAALKQNTSLDAVALGQTIIDGYKGQAASSKKPNVTLALTDLRTVSGVRDAMMALVDKIQGGDLASVQADLGQAKNGSREFGKSGDGKKSSQMIDIGDFVSRVAKARPELAAETANVTKAISQSVTVNFTGEAAKSATGLSIYFPTASAYSKKAAAYGELVSAGWWKSFLDQYYNVAAQTSQQLKPVFTNAENLAELEALDEASFAIRGQLKEGTAASVSLAQSLYGYTFDNQGVEQIILAGDGPALVDEATGVVSASWNLSLLRLTQGDKVDFGYASIELQDGFYAVTVPGLYKEDPAQPDEEAPIASMRLYFNENFELTDSPPSLFLPTDEDAWSEQEPAEGSIFKTLLAVVDDQGEASYATVNDVEFDLRSAYTADFERLESGKEIVMQISVADESEEGDYVLLTSTIP